MTENCKLQHRAVKCVKYKEFVTDEQFKGLIIQMRSFADYGFLGVTSADRMIHNSGTLYENHNKVTGHVNRKKFSLFITSLQV